MLSAPKLFVFSFIITIFCNCLLSQLKKNIYWLSFVFTYIINYRYYFFMWIQVIIWCHFFPIQRILFTISYKTGLQATILSAFVYLRISLFHFLLWRIILLNIELSVDRFLSFSTLNISSYCLWPLLSLMRSQLLTLLWVFGI